MQKEYVREKYINLDVVFFFEWREVIVRLVGDISK